MAADRVGFLQMSPASYQQWGRGEVRLHPVGTGPFKLAKWEPNQVIVLEKNPHYFKPGQPYIFRYSSRYSALSSQSSAVSSQGGVMIQPREGLAG